MLKPEVSLGVGLATAAIVFATYNGALPSVADVRVAKPNDSHINSSRNLAAWTSAAVVGAVSLMAKDPTIFVVGGSMVIALDWWHRYANQVNPTIGAVPGKSAMTAPTATGPATSDVYSYDQ
jgi:alpha-beta hydrolase superfamily lysophospholipase